MEMSRVPKCGHACLEYIGLIFCLDQDPHVQLVVLLVSRVFVCVFAVSISAHRFI